MFLLHAQPRLARSLAMHRLQQSLTFQLQVAFLKGDTQTRAHDSVSKQSKQSTYLTVVLSEFVHLRLREDGKGGWREREQAQTHMHQGRQAEPLQKADAAAKLS